MRTLLIGCGNVGCGVASYLAFAGVELHLLARPETARLLSSHGLRRSGVLGDAYVPPGWFRVYSSLGSVPRVAFDLVLLCTKAYSVEEVVGELAGSTGLIAAHTQIVLFCNGIGLAEIVAERFDQDRVHWACVMTGFEKTDPTSFRVTVHVAPLLIGNPLTGRADGAETLCSLLSQNGLTAQPAEGIELQLWSKLLFNCVVNPLSALLQAPIGRLAGQPSLRPLIEGIVREIFAVMKTMQRRTYWATPEEYLDVLYGQLIPRAAGHFSSMAQDLASGKRTEIDYLNGAIVRLGRECSVLTPANHWVTQAIKLQERRSQAALGAQGQATAG